MDLNSQTSNVSVFSISDKPSKIRPWRSFKRKIHYFLLILTSIFFMGPFIWLLLISLLPATADLFHLSLNLFKNGFSFSAYSDVWKVAHFGKYISNTILVASIAAVLQIIFCSMSGYALSRMKFKGRNALFVLILSTMMIPLEVTVIPSYLVVNSLNLLNTYWALILPTSVTPFAVFLFRQAFLKLPLELEEAARIDGCSEFKLYYKIMLPLVAPAIATVGIFTFVSEWSSLLWPLVVLKDNDMYTVSIGLTTLDSAFYGGWRQISAGAIISLLPVLVVFLLGQKYFIRGIASGSVKE